MQKALRTVIRICEVVFFAVVSYSVMVLMPSLTNVSAALRIPRLWYYMPVLVFGAYMALVIVVDLINECLLYTSLCAAGRNLLPQVF